MFKLYKKEQECLLKIGIGIIIIVILFRLFKNTYRRNLVEGAGGRISDRPAEERREEKEPPSPWWKFWKAEPDDPCRSAEYAVDNYGRCCSGDRYKKEGHGQVCKEAKQWLKQREDDMDAQPYGSSNISDTDDPCLVHEYAVDNYGTCCAHGGYLKEGHEQVCNIATSLVKSEEHNFARRTNEVMVNGDNRREIVQIQERLGKLDGAFKKLIKCKELNLCVRRSDMLTAIRTKDAPATPKNEPITATPTPKNEPITATPNPEPTPGTPKYKIRIEDPPVSAPPLIGDVYVAQKELRKLMLASNWTNDEEVIDNVFRGIGGDKGYDYHSFTGAGSGHCSLTSLKVCKGNTCSDPKGNNILGLRDPKKINNKEHDEHHCPLISPLERVDHQVKSALNYCNNLNKCKGITVYLPGGDHGSAPQICFRQEMDVGAGEKMYGRACMVKKEMAAV